MKPVIMAIWWYFHIPVYPHGKETVTRAYISIMHGERAKIFSLVYMLDTHNIYKSMLNHRLTGNTKLSHWPQLTIRKLTEGGVWLWCLQFIIQVSSQILHPDRWIPRKQVLTFIHLLLKLFQINLQRKLWLFRYLTTSIMVTWKHCIIVLIFPKWTFHHNLV